MSIASYGFFSVDSGTLEDGGEVILVDSASEPRKTYGTLNKSDGEYVLMKDDTGDEKLSGLSVTGTIINVDSELADVAIRTVNADGSESVFTVKPTAGAKTFRVDATGTSPKIDGVDEIELISGKVQPQAGQIVNGADGEKDLTISYGNGEHQIGDKTVIIDGLEDGDTIDFELDENGNIKRISGMAKGATVTIDGTKYTAPFDDATLMYDEDGWYFDGWTLEEYTVTIDADGNIKVDTGIRFRNVISSGRKLGDDGRIELSSERGGSSVKITNESGKALTVSEPDGTLAENLSAALGVTFGTGGVSADDLQAVAGATITLSDGQSLTAGDETTVTATDGATVAVEENSINVDGAAQIEAPAETELNLTAGDYSVNGVSFTSGEKTQATATADGVEFKLADSTGLSYDGMNLTGSGSAEVNSDGKVTLTDGAIAENTTGKTLTIAGAVQLDDKTVKVDEATEVSSTDKGLNVGETELEVEGDEDGYIINITEGAITGLENIGSASGVTVSGLDDASIKSDKSGYLTVGDKTFWTSDNSVTWIDDGQIAEVVDVEGTVKGDFSDGLTVNGENIQVQSDKNSEVEVIADADGVTAIQATEADKYTINGKQYETGGEIKFNMSGGAVTGVETDDATFAIGQNETAFTVNNETLNLSRNSKPVTLDVDGGAISGVYGVDGAIAGLSNATVYDLTRATVNGTPLDVSGSTFDAQVAGGSVGSIVGVSAPATINSAPNLSIITSGDGAFTFGGNTYHVSDSLDTSVTFTTDEQSGLTAINDFAGEVSGAVNTLNLNGKDFGTNNGKVTVASDGENITAIDGVQSGDSIGGDLDSASFTLPEGNLTINGGEFILEDNDGDAQATNGGKIITGIAKDASLTVGADGSYRVDGKTARATAGGVFTVNRDGSYLINPEHLPIIEKTPADVIRSRGGNGLALIESNGTIGAGNDSVVVRRGAAVNVDASGEPLIIATSGNVTLENYAGGNASVGTFEYLNLGNAVQHNAIMFGDGVMTLGDAVITFDAAANPSGATMADLVNAQGRNQVMGFTHTAGGTLDGSNATANLVFKGNYAEKSDDTQKSGSSYLIGGAGDDTLLGGAGDVLNAGDGTNHIYLTDSKFRDLGATIIFSAGKNTVHNFNGGYGAASDKIIIADLNGIEFSAGNSELVMRSGDAQLTFTGMTRSSELVNLAESSDAASNLKDTSYRLQLQAGDTTYNAAVAQAGKNIEMSSGDLANVFYGDGSGINFSEYVGAVAVNLNAGTGAVGGQAARFSGIDKLTAGAGNTTLTGAADMSNTLAAGTGNGQIWSNSGNDLMIGNTDAAKTGMTTFNYLANDGQDTIAGFDFASDWIDITTANEVTSVSVRGSDVIMYINESETDYLTLAQGKGNDFKINNLVAQVDDNNLEFDGLANCFVATGTNATLAVSETLDSATIWLSDGKTSVHGAYYLGDITVIDGSKSAGSLILVGNELDNTILGGAGANSIYGGMGDDVLIGGAGQNTFFFAMVNGHDVIQSANDGDVIDLGALTCADVTNAAISTNGTAIALSDGSLLEVRSNAAVEYKTADGTYTADHVNNQWVKKQ